MNKPLADRIRPTTLDEVVGQSHLLGDGKVLRAMIESGRLSNMIFYGPSGTGKTTVANIAAASSNKTFYQLNATNASLADVKHIIAQLDVCPGGILLYLDEIQNFNKKQQQSLLEFIETGDIILIASTTENPHFYVYNAILSRSTVFEFKPLSPADVERAVMRAISVVEGDLPDNKVVFTPDAISHLAHMANGDVRRAINGVELATYSVLPDKDGCITVTLDIAEQASQKKALVYDRDGDSHYDLLSGFQKSIRGSDPDAAMYYLARLVGAGDLASICRRLMVTAAEDIGLAYPMAITIVKSCVDCALQLGFPEARIPLAEGVLLLATAPKSNSAISAIDAAMADLATKGSGEIPAHLKDSHYPGAKALERGITYQYPHSFPNHYTPQQYLPDLLAGSVYYKPGTNKFEQSIQEYWDKIKNKS